MTVTETAFPGVDWETDAPEAHGLDPAALARAAEELRALLLESVVDKLAVANPKYRT